MAKRKRDQRWGKGVIWSRCSDAMRAEQFTSPAVVSRSVPQLRYHLTQPVYAVLRGVTAATVMHQTCLRVLNRDQAGMRAPVTEFEGAVTGM
jgi:hypothetical protein